MKLLFEAEFNTDPQDTLAMLEPLDLTDQDRAFMARIKSGVLDNLDQIDAALEKYVVGWQPERLAKVDRSILRLAVYELLFTDVPASVVVNEAVNMAGVFSSDESTAFVIGILGNFVRDHSADRQL
jgi:N utilization substance protein B